MERTINWGIIGCGRIAQKFTDALSVVSNTKLLAVASQTPGKALEFAKNNNVTKWYDNYEALAMDKDIDAIYIANTHNFHKEAAIICLKNKKAVLCEKPLTINANDTQVLIDIAKKENAFLMEAMWTRFHPSILIIKGLLNDGIIGDVKVVKADFGIVTQYGTAGRHLNKDLAGGALLDIGIYPITMAYIIFGTDPSEIASTALIGNTDVDETSSYLFQYLTGQIAVLSASVILYMPHIATIYGTKGRITIPDFFHAEHFTIHIDGKKDKELKYPFLCNGYEYEIMEVNECIRKGKKESDIMPLKETLRIMKTMDALRTQWGLKYMGE
jgi:predicted dehydrogenase